MRRKITREDIGTKTKTTGEKIIKILTYSQKEIYSYKGLLANKKDLKSKPNLPP